MPDGMREELERQVARLLEEAERPMRVEEILPHLGPVMPTPNDVADVLQELTQKHEVEREGSFFARPTPVPIDHLFRSPPQREVAQALVEILRGADEGLTLRALLDAARERGVSKARALDVLAVLRNAGEVYSGGRDTLLLSKG